jgi:hypothetical protein
VNHRSSTRALAPLALFSILSTAALPAGAAVVSSIDEEVLRLREAAWRAWFAGDEATLRAMLPAEFIGLDMGDGPFRDVAATLGESRAFAAGGGRLVTLEFPETRAQRYGDTVILYGRYRVVLESDGRRETIAGRLTEIFVRRDDKWSHPGWHLDTVSTLQAPRSAAREENGLQGEASDQEVSVPESKPSAKREP